MSYSFTATESSTFTFTNAKYLASKVATDLKRMQRLYGSPSDSSIDQYEEELALLIKHGYLKKVYYGYKKNDQYIEPTLIYTPNDLSMSTNDDPGKIKQGKDISGASFYSFLEYSSAWNDLSEEEREAFRGTLPLQRGTASSPGINGYIDNDRTYSSGGKSLARSSVRSYL